MAASGDEVMVDDEEKPMFYLPWKPDAFEGVVVGDLSIYSSTDPQFFIDSLHHSLELWRSQKKKGVWLKIPTQCSLFVHPAIQAGFKYHHAEPDTECPHVESSYVMLVHWLSDEPSTLPANASHIVGAGAFVLNDQRQMLAVKEKYGPFTDKWKMPTGAIHQGEDIFEGIKREVKEETGVETEFVEVIGFRQSHKGTFGKSDVFFLCVLHALPHSSTITVQEAELADAKWMSIAEFRDQDYLKERKMLKKMLDACIEAADAPARKGFRIDNVQAGTQRRPQYFYNNSAS